MTVEIREYEVRIRLFLREKRPGVWIAQAVNYDLNAQGSSFNRAMDAFALTLAGQIILDIERLREPLSTLGEPPPEVLEGFNEGWRLEERELHIPAGVVPPPWVIKAQLAETRVHSSNLIPS